MPFTKHATDRFISRKIGELTECGASQVSAEFPSAGKWVSTFGLSVMFHNRPPAATRAYALQIVRRIEMAFEEYEVARAQLADFVRGGPGRWSPYFRCLHHFETAISQLWMAYELGRKGLKQNLFTSKDGSPLDRLNRVHGASKHELAVGDQPAWLTNSDIATADASVSFVEIEEMLRECGRIADVLTGQRPFAPPTEVEGAPSGDG